MSQQVYQPNIPKIRFDKSGYYFIGLVVLAFLGFWATYFSKFFDGETRFNFYFHFHAAMVSLWILVLIVQPTLIRKKKLAIHKIIGKLTYVLMPLLFVSVILLTHSRLPEHITVINGENFYGPHLVVPFKDLLILGTAYIIAVVYRRDFNIHARAMVATGIVFIEPALFRFIFSNHFVTEVMPAYFWTIGIVYALLIGLMILERKQKRGRWVFPLVLGLYIIVHSIIIFGINTGAWETFARWFAALPLT